MSEILIGQFLLRRLKELGIQTIFGVPGDFELAFLELLEHEDGIEWVGTPNELVGAYAADGYARFKGAGALVTTFGPGELSALCGIGGSFCEFVPVVHIVGYPTTQSQKSGKILHHTLGDGSYEHYIKISSELSCATAVLKHPETAIAEIDRVLNAMIFNSQPVYIGISEDVAYTKVSAEYLKTPLIKTLSASAPSGEAKALAEIMKVLEAAKAPTLVVDGGAARQQWHEYVDPLIEALKIPFFVTTLGKGVANEQSSYFGGSYGGLGSEDNVLKAVESADCILWLGNYPSDFNTAFFTEHVEKATVIDFQRFAVQIGSQKFDARINTILPQLIEAVKSHAQFPQIKVEPAPEITRSIPSTITQDWFFNRLTSFLKPGDLIVTETGTSQFGILETKLPKGAMAWTQAVYGSIGYATGAAVGGSIASKETGKFKRMIVVTGEGSLQLTVQAFSILNRHGIIPVVFIINNAGYTVERYFCGMNSKYNDVPMWDYGQLFKALAPEVASKAWKVEKPAELDKLLSDPEVGSATVPLCFDIVMDKVDAPIPVKKVFEAKNKNK